MYKYILSFVAIIITLAIVIRCNRSNEEELYETVIVNEINSSVVNEMQENDVIAESVSDEAEDDLILTDSSRLELPRLMMAKPEQILFRLSYTVSYNNVTKNANWVAWHLLSKNTDGPWTRDGVPYKVDYEVNGTKQDLEDWDDLTLPLDHGHLCPAGDNKWSEEAMEQSFLLTNMCPQNSRLNRGVWERLEDRCRGWARHYGGVYIVAGPIFYDEEYATIGRNGIGIPDAFYKVVLCLDNKPKALGFIFPNEDVSGKFSRYVTTVDEVESVANIDFFHLLPDNIEEKVESVSNINSW